MLQAAGIGAATLAGCSGGDGGDGGDGDGGTTQQQTTQGTTMGTTSQELVEQHILISEGAADILAWFWGTQNGAWEQYGIDLTVEVAPFPKVSRSVTADLNPIGAISVPAGINFSNEGEELTWIGMKIPLINSMFSKKGSGFDDPSQLGDARLGVPFESSTTTNAYKAIFLEEYDFDILEDTKLTRASPPPVLYNLLKDDELDVIIEFTADTIRGLADPDVQRIFSPYDFWSEKYSLPPAVSNFTARTSWIEENAEQAANFLKGWKAAIEMTTENVDEAVTNFGRLAGVSSDEEAVVLKDLIGKGRAFGPAAYPEKLAENNWLLAEQMAAAGSFETLPEKDTMLTPNAELSEMAGVELDLGEV